LSLEFYNKLDKLFPHTDARSWYEGKPEKIKSVGEMNATLQGAYFMLAARSVGLDCGPMGGFNEQKHPRVVKFQLLQKRLDMKTSGYYIMVVHQEKTLRKTKLNNSASLIKA
jgi:nitroreductase